MKVKLATVSRNPDLAGGLRTSEVTGTAEALPRSGERFTMLSEPLDSALAGAGIRVVQTSAVVDVTEHGTENGVTMYSFRTVSESRYHLDVLAED